MITTTQKTKLDLCYSLWFNLKALGAEKRSSNDEYRIKMIRENIKYDFELLDAAKISFKIQNIVIAGAEKGRGFQDDIKPQIIEMLGGGLIG